MFNSLSGEVSGLSGDHVRLSSAGGVEWELEVSSHTAASCVLFEPARLLVYLHHREDILRLYGFVDERERALFLQLIRLPGIGPRQALRMLSGMPPDELIRAVHDGDDVKLSTIPGLGIKTAQKIIVALRGRLDLESDRNTGASRADDDIVVALVEMGYERKRAYEAVRRAHAEMEGEATWGDTSLRERELLRRAIVFLG